MKRLLSFISCLIATFMVHLMYSCNNLPGAQSPVVDETIVAEYVEQALNPTMTSANEVVLYHSSLSEEYKTDEIFCNLATETIRNIAYVCIKQNGSVTKKDIVEQYLANKDIYDNLPASGQPAKENTKAPNDTSTDSPKQPTVSLPPSSTTIRTEDDTVNGVPLKVTIKEEKTYEQKN